MLFQKAAVYVFPDVVSGIGVAQARFRMFEHAGVCLMVPITSHKHRSKLGNKSVAVRANSVHRPLKILDA
jgi:hypothetical protein